MEVQRFPIRGMHVSCGLFFSFLLGCEQPQVSRPSATPGESLLEAVLSCDEPLFDGGKVNAQELVENTFIVKNVSDGVVHLQEPAVSCDCIAMELPKRELLPDETVQVHLVMVPHSEEGFMGPRVQEGMLLDDSGTELLRLELRSFVTGPLQIIPSRVDFGRMSRSEAARKSRRITIRSTENSDFQLVGQETSEWLATARWEQRPDTEQSIFEVSIAIGADPELGHHEEVLRLQTNDPRSPIVEIPIVFQVVSDLQSKPARAFFGEVAVDEAKNQELTLIYPTPARIWIEQEVKGTVSVEYDSEKLAEQHSIVIRFQSALTGDHTGNIIIRTVEPTPDVLAVPFFARVLPRESTERSKV